MPDWIDGRGLYHYGKIATAAAGRAINGGVALNGNRIYERAFIVFH